jgi:hypothetical protein
MFCHQGHLVDGENERSLVGGLNGCFFDLSHRIDRVVFVKRNDLE